MAEDWYYADLEVSVGPLTIAALKKTLRSLPNSNEVLVWCSDFTEWKKAAKIPELRARMPPPVPGANNNEMPRWRVRWWWYPVAVLFFGSIGSRTGRNAMAWTSSERRTKRALRRLQPGKVDE